MADGPDPRADTAALLQGLVQAAPDGMLALARGADGGLAVAALNEVAAGLTGACAGAALETVPLLAGWAAALARVAETGEPVAADLMPPRPQAGDPPPALPLHGAAPVRMRATRGGDFVLVGLAAAAVRLDQEAAARRNAEARLSDAIERLRDGFILYDAEDRVVLFNTRFRDYYPELADILRPGITFEALVRRAAGLVVHPEDGDLEGWVERRMAAHRNPSGPLHSRLNDGRHIRITEHRTAEGGIVALGIDVTDIKASEDRLLGLIEGSVQGILIHRGARPLFANQSYARLFGFASPEELLDRGDILALIPPEGRDRFAAETAHMLREGGTVQLSGAPACRIDGTPFWVDVMMRRVEWTDGPALQSTITDVTERVRAQEVMRHARDAAEAASVAKTRFLAVMSHELRTPMTGVIGMVDLLLDTDPTPVQRGYLETLRSSADSLLVVLNDVLDFSKIEAGQLVLERVPFRPGPLADDVMRLFAPAAAAKGVTLDWTLPPRTPPVLGDPTRLRQVLTNLVGNAVKFTEAGRIELRLDELVREGDRWVLNVEVRDTGIGIPPGTLDQLFDAFVQADASTTRRFGGTGLGLAICRRLVDMMGGEIGVESEPGLGSIFWFTVRLEAVPDAEMPPRAGPPLPGAGAAPPKGARVLLAEDNQVNRLLIATMLERMGHRPDSVEDGLKAVEAVERGAYDLVLMDMQMPELDGEAAAARIRAMPGPKSLLPIVALTADVLPEERDRRLRAALFDGYLTKPIDWAELDATIRRLALGPAAVP